MVRSSISQRSATVEFDKTWLSQPTNWALRIVGQSIGGYGFINHSARTIPTARYGTREAADRAAALWIETGLTPAYQTDERVAEVRAQLAAAVKVAA